MDMKSILVKKRIAKSNLTTLKDKINSEIAKADETKIELFKKKLNILSSDILRIFDNIYVTCEEKKVDTYVEEYQTVQNTIDDLYLDLERKGFLLDNVGLVSVKLDTTEAKLPKLTLPTFNEILDQCLTFSDLFKANVHNNVKLSDAQWLQYLKSSCKTEALKIIQAIPISNCKIAWDLLEDRFSNKHKVCGNLTHVSLPSMIVDSFSDLILADPAFYESAPIDILLRVNVFIVLVLGEPIKQNQELPTAVRSKLGANDTIIRKDVSEQLKSEVIWTPPYVTLQIVPYVKIDTNGKLSLNITIESAAYPHMAYVADITDPCIHGLDFLRKYNFPLDFKNSELHSASKDITLFGINDKVVKSFHKIVAQDNITIPATTKFLLLRSIAENRDFLCRILGYPKNCNSPKGFLVASSLLSLSRTVIRMRVANVTEKARVIEKGEVVQHVLQ
ncbi:hypothetical protein X975_06730, partial [Stegodyphus mimosarum]